MVIRASTVKEVDALIDDLSSDHAVTRDAAVARLAVIGARSATRLLAVARGSQSPVGQRIGALRALEAIGEPRILPIALAALDSHDTELAIAAVAVVRDYLHGDAGVMVLDKLTGLALNLRSAAVVRVAAIQALRDLSPATVAPVFAALTHDPDLNVVSAVAGDPPGLAQTARSILVAAAAGQLPETAASLKAALTEAARDVPVTTLHQIVEKAREREQWGPPAGQAEWSAARAAAHVALADRGSRLALYDVRDTIAAARGPIAVDYVAALTRLGDPASLEAIAAAFAHAPASDRDDWWRRSLRDAFQAIVERHRLTKRHATMKKIAKRWPNELVALSE